MNKIAQIKSDNNSSNRNRGGTKATSKSARYRCAKALVAKGFKIFRLKPNGKTPVATGWQKEAALDAKPWVGGADYNIGMVAEDDWLFVDIDMKGGVDGEANWKALGIDESDFQSQTPTVGRHIIYKLPDGVSVSNSASQIAPGVDIRGNGGYIVAIGSVIDGKMYTAINKGAQSMEVPAELIAICNKKRTREDDYDVPAGDLDTPENIELAENYLDKYAHESIEGAGGDHTAFSVAAQVRDMGISETKCLDMMLDGGWNSRCEPPWSGEELEIKVQNAYRYATGRIGADTPEAQFADEPDSGQVSMRVLSAVEIMNKTHAVVAVGTSYVVIEEYQDKDGRKRVEYFGETAFHRMTVWNSYIGENGKRQYVSREWIVDPRRRTYRGFAFNPEVIGPVEGKYNHWRGFTYTPLHGVSPDEAKKMCNLFLRHIRDTVCGGDIAHYKWVLNHFAHLIQFPWKKPETSIIVVGKKGAGKSLIFDVIGSLARDNYVLTAEKRMLLGQFNSHMETVLVFQFEEAFWAGDKAAEGKLKLLITGKHHMIERKGFEPYMVGNYARIYITSNNDWAVPATVDERRFAVFECLPDKIGDKPYFKAIYDQLEHNGGMGYRALMTVLSGISVDQTAVHVAPHTDALADQKMETLEPDALWMYERLAAGCLAGCLDRGDFESEIDDAWQGEEPTEYVFGLYSEFAKVRGFRYPKSDKSFGKSLAKMLKGNVKRIRINRKEQKGYYYDFENLEKCRASFEKWFGHDIEW